MRDMEIIVNIDYSWRFKMPTFLSLDFPSYGLTCIIIKLFVLGQQICGVSVVSYGRCSMAS